MRKIKWILLLICMLAMVLCGCNSSNKISELETEIANKEYEIIYYQNELEEWESIYYKAKSAYNKYKYSTDFNIRKELEKTEEIMNEADEKIDDINREIRLLKREIELREIELYEKQIATLKKD